MAIIILVMATAKDLGRVLMLTMGTVGLGSDQLSYDMALAFYVAMLSSS